MNKHPCQRPLIAVHFPKAGGSAFRTTLQTALGKDAICLSYDCDPVDPANPMWTCPDWFLRNRPATIEPYRAVYGHLPIQKFDLVPDSIRIVLLREPVQNLISIYFFWCAMFEMDMRGHGLYEFVKKERLSLFEFAHIPALRYLMSRSYFGGYDMRGFDVVGVYDRRREYFDEVSRRLGISLLADGLENVTPPSEERGNVMADSKLIRQLRDLLRDDVRFYERYSNGAWRQRSSKSFFVSWLERSRSSEGRRAASLD
jgi:hypothetical protein